MFKELFGIAGDIEKSDFVNKLVDELLGPASKIVDDEELDLHFNLYSSIWNKLGI